MYYVVHQVANISHEIILAGSDLELLVRLDFRRTAYLVSHLGCPRMSVGPPPWNQILPKSVCAKFAIFCCFKRYRCSWKKSIQGVKFVGINKTVLSLSWVADARSHWLWWKKYRKWLSGGQVTSLLNALQESKDHHQYHHFLTQL